MDEEIRKELLNLWERMFIVLGLDIKDPNLKDTPERIVRFWDEFLFYQDGNIETVFPSVQVDQLVIVKDVPFYSLCSHHFLVFHGNVHFGYLASSKIIGLSKIPRIIKKCASRLQSQEQLAHDIADCFQEIMIDTNLTASVPSVAVIVEGNHTCMQMRGIRSQGKMVTSVLRGAFREDESVKDEFLRLVGF